MNKGIYGVGSSVVSESLTLLPKHDFTILNIVSKQSLISAMSPPVGEAVLLEKGSLSRNQFESLKADAKSMLIDDLHAFSLGVDVLVLDLTDEIDGIYINEYGQVLTASRTFRTSPNFVFNRNQFRFVRFGSDEHFSLWTSAVDEFVQFLSGLDILKKSLVIKNRWATQTRQGISFPLTPGGLDPNLINQVYTRYFEYLSSISGLEMLVPPENLSISDMDHKWGPSPYHYIDTYYQFIALRVEELSNGVGAH